MADVTESQDVESRAHGEGEGAQPLDALLQAVKIAAAGAAVGAAAAAARALSHRDEEHAEDEEEAEEDERAVDDVEQQPQAEAQEEPEPEEPEEPRDPEEPEEPEHRAVDEQESGDEEPVQGVSAGDAKNAVTRAREQLEELIERQVESVSSLERTQDGWRVAFEVLELSRIPESTDVLASYEMELDDDLNLRGYHQAHRYYRSQAGSGEGA